MTPDIEQRYHPRVPVQWPTVFFTSQVFGHGTVVDVSALAWRIHGSVPVIAGMQLAVLVWPQLSSYFEIEEGTVLWARDKEFALEIYQVRAQHISGMIRLQEQTLSRTLGPLANGHITPVETTCLPRPHLLHQAARLQRAPLADRRKSARILAHCHVHYRRTDGHLGVLEEGLIKDLSLTGCHVITKAALAPGHRITLVVYFNDGELPITLPGTTVCWAQNHRFGITFPELTCEEHTRLKAIVEPDTTLISLQEPMAKLSDEGGDKTTIVLCNGRSAAATRKD